MMTFFKEYGLVLLLIIVGVGGFLLLGDEREDILASSLDALGQRLMDMVDDTDAKAKAAETFEDFKAKVASNEIAPEQLERIAANVLNLTSSGAKLSPEEADMVLDLSMEGEASALPMPELVDTGGDEPAQMTPVAPEPTVMVHTWSREASDELGERLATLVKLADKVKEMSVSAESNSDMAMSFQYVVDGGLKVVVDTVFSHIWAASEMQALAQDMERARVVVWENNVHDARKRHVQSLRAQRERLENTRISSPELPLREARKIMALERLNRLQEAGVVLQIDSTLYRLRMEMVLEEALRAVETEFEFIQQDATDEKIQEENSAERSSG